MSEPAIELKFERTPNGFSCSCPLGLWSVSGPTMRAVMREVLHYHQLYRDGGEYNELLSRTAPSADAGKEGR